MASPNLIHLQVVDLMAVDFDAMLAKAGDKLLVIDVFTQWCGPCKVSNAVLIVL